MRKLLLATLLISWGVPGWAAFDFERTGARAAGLAGAFTGIADNADALIYNPAGLMNINHRLLSSNYGRLLTGLDEGQLTESELAYIYPTRESGSFGVLWYQKNLSGFYQENVVAAGYAQALDSDKKFKAGIAMDLLFLDYLDREALLNNEIFKDRSSLMTVALKIGLFYTVIDHLSIGLTAANLNQPNLSIFDDQVNLPLVLRLGSAYQTDYYTGVVDILLSDGNYRLSSGVESWWVNKQLGVRIGYALGNGGMSELATGISFNLKQTAWALQFDYAFVLPLGEQQQLGASHQVSLQYRYAGVIHDELEIEGFRLKKEGKQALDWGKRHHALEMWEEAIEYLPDDEELAADIMALQDEIEKQSEFAVYKKQGLDYEKNNDLINASKAYRKALDIIPEDDEVNLALSKVTQKLQSLNKKQLAASRAKLRKSKVLLRKAASKNLQEANKLLKSSQRNRKLLHYFKSDIKHLAAGLEKAKTFYRQKDYRAASAKSISIIEDVQRLKSRALIKERARMKRAKIRLSKNVTKKQNQVVKKVSDSSAAKLASQRVLSRADAQKRLRKKARGAYGRAIKLMIDIDQLNGAKYFPTTTIRLKNELVVIKFKLKRELYQETIKAAEKLYPELKKIMQSCRKKESARKAMPTIW